jgi:hypothetical protein
MLRQAPLASKTGRVPGRSLLVPAIRRGGQLETRAKLLTADEGPEAYFHNTNVRGTLLQILHARCLQVRRMS